MIFTNRISLSGDLINIIVQIKMQQKSRRVPAHSGDDGGASVWFIAGDHLFSGLLLISNFW
jgi:hypothetical protein